MKKNTEPLQPNVFYHIYNRGINGEPIFKEERNYTYFLQQYAKHMEHVVDTYAYCLLSNHFHILIRTKPEDEILAAWKGSSKKSASFHLGNQFAKLFNGYCQAINAAYERTKGLFESPFRRIEVTSDAYLSHLIAYIHFNPQKHGFVDDFTEYPHSSYHSHLLKKLTRLKRQEVLEWFGGTDQYGQFHDEQFDERSIDDLIIEVDY